jgi:CRP-like cAMP-binding protein
MGDAIVASDVTALPAQRRALPSHKSAMLPVAAKLAALLHLKAVSRSVRSGQEIISEGKRCSAVFLIAEGIAIRFRILRDGQRQILDFLLPGDLAGITSCRFDNALYSVRMLTPGVVSPVPVARLLGLFETHPQQAAELFWSFAAETAILAEHLIAVGRRSAPERIAHFLLELHARLHKVGLADETRYRLPLTQEMISDALGLSIPYVNRILQQLRQDGLVMIKDQLVVIENMEELAALADFEQAYLRPLSIAEFVAAHQ